jgi:hypothetical protein
MGIEHGGSSQEDAPGHRRKVDHVDGVQVRDTSAPEPGTGQSGEGAGAVSAAVPVDVFNRIEELQKQLEAAQAKLEHQREMARERDRRWRQSHPDEVRERTRQRTAAHRARKRQAGS